MIVFISLFSIGQEVNASDIKKLEPKVNVPLDKVWTITFSDSIDPKSVNGDTVYITLKGDLKTLPIMISTQQNKVIVTPGANYKYNTEYVLHVENILSVKGIKLNPPVEMDFQTIDNTVDTVEYLRWNTGAYWGHYFGEVLNGIPNGKGQWIGEERGRFYDGGFKNGKFHGTGQYSWPTGESYTGSYVNGIIQGRGLIKWADGESYEGSFENGIIQGHGLFKYANGDSYEGSFVNGIRQGYGLYKWANGDSYFGMFHNGQIVDEAKEEEKYQKYKRCMEKNLENIGNGTPPIDCSIYLR